MYTVSESYWLNSNPYSAINFSLVTQLCPMSNSLQAHGLQHACIIPASSFPVHHQLPELTQTQVLWVGDAMHHLIHCCPLLLPPSNLQSFPASGSFPMSQFFSSGGQNIGVSASTSVLPMNNQDWFPLGLTCMISLQFRGLWRVFSNTTVQKHQFLGAQLSLHPTLPSIHDYWRNHCFN